MLLFVFLRGTHEALQPFLSTNVRSIAVIVSSRVILDLRHVAGTPEKLSLATLTLPPQICHREEEVLSEGMRFARPGETELEVLELGARIRL